MSRLRTHGAALAVGARSRRYVPCTIRRPRALNHPPVKSRFNSRPRGSSDLIGHCVDHAHYPATVPHVIANAADFLTLVQRRRSWLETRLDRQDAVLTVT